MEVCVQRTKLKTLIYARRQYSLKSLLDYFYLTDENPVVYGAAVIFYTLCRNPHWLFAVRTAVEARQCHSPYFILFLWLLSFFICKKNSLLPSEKLKIIISVSNLYFFPQIKIKARICQLWVLLHKPTKTLALLTMYNLPDYFGDLASFFSGCRGTLWIPPRLRRNERPDPCAVAVWGDEAHRDVHWLWVVLSEKCLVFNSCLRGTVSELAAINRVILLF